MPETSFCIHPDGRFSIGLDGIELDHIVPFVDGCPVLTQSVETGEGFVRYIALDGTLTLRLGRGDGGVVLSTEIEGFAGAHDIEPAGSAVMRGADNAYIQGFGMEGPSGFFPIDKNELNSHGIIGLSGEGCACAVYAKDHRRFSTRFSAGMAKGLYSETPSFAAGISLEGCTDGSAVRLPDLYFTAGTDVTECMSRAAEDIASAMDARTHMEPGFHWCSWYYHYENLTRDSLADFLRELGKDRIGFNYIQIDAGYTPHTGDWLTPNHRYPGGLAEAAELIREAGYEAGIWIAPFMAGDHSELYRRHPDWVLHEPGGSPYVRFRSYTEPKIWGSTDNDYYVVDMTHPDAKAYIRSVFEAFREWGFRLYKTDFLLWGMQDSSEVVRYDGTKTSVEVMRDTLAMIRSVIGEDSYLLGSIAPFMPCIGYMDGMRIASDMGAQWTEGAFGPSNLLRELPFDNYFNNVFWQNDPDAVILRDFGTHLTDEESWSLALLQALSGGIITTSDPVEKLPEKRRELLRLIRPAGRVRAELPYLTEQREELVITHNLHDWDLLYVLNPSGHPVRVHFRLDELFGPKALFQYRYDRNDGGNAGSVKSSDFSAVLQPHGSALLFITEEPLREKPHSLWHR